MQVVEWGQVGALQPFRRLISQFDGECLGIRGRTGGRSRTGFGYGVGVASRFDDRRYLWLCTVMNVLSRRHAIFNAMMQMTTLAQYLLYVLHSVF